MKPDPADTAATVTATAGATKGVGRTLPAAVRPVATCAVQLLPRCAACGARHPLSLTPPLDAGHCWACNADLPPPPPPAEVPAALTGAPGLLARLLLALGRGLARLSNRIARTP